MADKQNYLSKLDGLRTRIKGFLVFQGVVYIACSLLAIVLFDLGLDRLLRLDLSQRVILTALLLGGLVWIAVRHLFGPASITLSDEDVAILIEHRDPAMRDRLISSLQFDRMIDAGKPVSRAMAEKVQSQAAEMAARIELGALIDSKRLSQLAMYGGIVALIGVASAMLIPGQVWETWVRRNLLFDSTADWPYRHRVVIEGDFDAEHTLRVPHGDAFPLVVRALKTRPDGSAYDIADTVEIHFRFGGGKWQMVEVHHTVHRDETFYRYELGALFRNVELEVVAGDYRSPRHRIEIASRPELTTVEVEIEAPAYTRGKDDPRTETRAAAGTIPIVAGSKIVLTGTSSKVLEKVVVHRGGVLVGQATIEGEDNDRFRIALDASDPKKPGNVKVLVTDFEGVTNRSAALFTLSVEPDLLPGVRAKPVGIGDRITRWARVPIQVEVRDRYGIGEVGLRYELTRRAKAGDAGDARRVVKGYLEQAKYARPGQKRFPKARCFLDLEKEFERRRAADPDLKPPAEGDRLRIWIEATDYGGTDVKVPRRASFPPQGMHFQIVPDTVLSKHLLAKQKRIRRQYAALLDREKAIQWVQVRLRSEAESNLADVARVRRLFRTCDVDKNGKITPKELAENKGGDAARHASLDKNKDGVLTPVDWGASWTLDNDAAKQVDRQEAEQRRILRAALRLAGGLTQIREEMENNKLDRDGQSRAKLEAKVIKPMKKLADRQMSQLAAGLEGLAKRVGEAPIGALDRNIDLSQEILMEMAEILRQMVWSELFDDVVTRLRTIFQLEQELRRLVEAEHRRRIESLLPEELRDKKGAGSGSGSGSGSDGEGSGSDGEGSGSDGEGSGSGGEGSGSDGKGSGSDGKGSDANK